MDTLAFQGFISVKPDHTEKPFSAQSAGTIE